MNRYPGPNLAGFLLNAMAQAEERRNMGQAVYESGRQFVRVPHSLENLRGLTLQQRQDWAMANPVEWVVAVKADKKFSVPETIAALRGFDPEGIKWHR